ncbi:hypothetical protein [Streptosporangium canum]
MEFGDLVVDALSFPYKFGDEVVASGRGELAVIILFGMLDDFR